MYSNPLSIHTHTQGPECTKNPEPPSSNKRKSQNQTRPRAQAHRSTSSTASREEIAKSKRKSARRLNRARGLGRVEVRGLRQVKLHDFGLRTQVPGSELGS